MEDKEKKRLEGTGLDLPVNRHGNLKSASSDQDFKDVLLQIKSSKTTAVINYGASWCRVCSQLLPAFCRLSNKFPKVSFIYADIDECPETTLHIRYTPTFHFMATVKELMRCLVLGKNGCTTGCGCTLKGKIGYPLHYL